ncbi:MAG: hypothetical protein K9M54_04600 [Kiritimatiellales bacterium]|nr:hypothetical protein [Kiritimatiellales bacterium]MCF7863522.1 hypothetical protein [Kiritimatiellales bacterium]
MRFAKAILCMLPLACLVPRIADGRVFRAVGVREGHLNTVGLPWEFAYHTTMNVNGCRNEVQVYSARFHEPVPEQLKSRFEAQGAEVVLRQTADSTFGIAKWPGSEVRILVLSPASQPSQMVFLFYPESGTPAAAPRFPVPGYPGGTAGNTVCDEDTHTYCTTIETRDSATQVHSFYAGMLAGEGWTPVIPPGRSGAQEGMAIFRKRERICCVLAKDRSHGLSRVTLLVKDSGL